jgi:hypothetical protein
VGVRDELSAYFKRAVSGEVHHHLDQDMGGHHVSREPNTLRSRACRQLAAMTLATGVALVVPSAVASAKGVTELTSCSFASLDKAVAGGGTIDYEQNCNVLFPTEIIFKGTVDIEANGFGVAFEGSAGRLFDLRGGHLTISGIDLQGGEVTGESGDAGPAGAPGEDGASGSSEAFADGGPAGPSTAGKNGSDGTAAPLPTATAPQAEGGALLIEKGGTVTLDDDTVSGDAIGGNGGPGGSGGTGGSGGDGGNGSEGMPGLSGQSAGAGGLPGGLGFDGGRRDVGLGRRQRRSRGSRGECVRRRHLQRRDPCHRRRLGGWNSVRRRRRLRRQRWRRWGRRHGRLRRHRRLRWVWS